MKNTLVITLVIFTLVISTTAFAKSMKGGKAMRMFAGLELTSEQKQDIAQIMRQMRQDNTMFKGEKQNLRVQMQTLMTQSEWDDTLARQLLSDSLDARAEVSANRAFARYQIANVLNDEQRAEVGEKWQTADKKSRGQKMMRKMQRRLGLSDEQQAQVTAIMEQKREQLAAYEDQIKQHKSAELELIHADTFDRDAFNTLNETFKPVALEIALLKTKARYDMAQVLTDEQREKAARFRTKIKDKAEKRRAI